MVRPFSLLPRQSEACHVAKNALLDGCFEMRIQINALL
jgi:hypothetical protein